MTTIQNIIIKLLKSELYGVLCDDLEFGEITNEQLDELYLISTENHITPIIYSSLKRNSISVTNQDWKSSSMASVINTELIIKGGRKIVSILHQNNIKVIWLKGIYIRQFYDKPEHRTMSDVDILIHKDDLEKSLALLKKNGYHIFEQDEGIEYGVIDAYGAYLELHTYLENPNKYIQAETFINPWVDYHSEPKIEEYGFFLSHEMNFIHIITHFARHLERKGAGIRFLFDIAVLVQKLRDQLDWVSLFSRLSELGLDNFAMAIFKACEKYLGVPSPFRELSERIDDKTIELLLVHMIAGGVYGRSENRNQVTLGIRRSGNFIKYFLTLHSYKHMKDRYPYLARFPFLLPISWIQRMYEVIIPGSHARKIFTDALTVKKSIKDEQYLFDKLKLSNLFLDRYSMAQK